MKVSFTGPRMGADVTVYLKDPYFGEYGNGLPVEMAFGPGTEIETKDLSEETKKIISGLVADGFAIMVKAPAKKKGELE